MVMSELYISVDLSRSCAQMSHDKSRPNHSPLVTMFMEEELGQGNIFIPSGLPLNLRQETLPVQ